MAASRLLRAVAAFVILLSFAARLRKSYWSGCMKAATVICQQIFSILTLVIFLLKILLKSASKSSCTTTVRGWTTKSRTTKFFKKCFKIVLHNNSTWLDDKESDDEVLRRQYRHLWEAVRSFQPEFVDAEMKRKTRSCRRGFNSRLTAEGWVCVVMNRIRV